MTDVVNVQVEMVAPKKWRRGEGLVRAENVARGRLTLALGHDPMLDANATHARVGPARDVTGSKNCGHVCFQKFIN